MLELYNSVALSQYSKYKSGLKSESRHSKSTYKNLLSANKHAPLYKLNMTDKKQQFALNIKNTALYLDDSLELLASPESSVFHSYKVFSSNTDTASVSILEHNPENMPDQITLKINSLAKPQINESYEVPSDDISTLSGSYSFIADVEDTLYEYQIHIAPNSTNDAVFHKLTDFINKSGIGVTASVNSPNKTSKLTLTSQATGDIGSLLFTLKDSGKVKRDDIGIITYYGLDKVTQRPKNSFIEINGEPKETLGNQITLNRSLTVTFNKSSNEPVLLQTSPDEHMVYEHMDKLLNTFNTLVDLASSNKDNRRSAKLLHDLNQVVFNNYELLKRSGVQPSDDEHLTFDKSISDESIKNGNMKELISGESSFYQDLKNIAQDISINPMDYIDKVFVTYPNISIPGFINPYSTSNYSGMLFNSYC